jgi:hypothetical protein
MSENAVPRLLSRSRLCAYLGDLPWAEVVHWIDAGRLPRPLSGASIVDVNARWDTGEIDRALDDVMGDIGGPNTASGSHQCAMVCH